MSRVAVMGSGSWGTAFAQVLADGGNDVRMWARREEVAESITERHANPDYLPGVELPAAISASHDPAVALDGAEYVVLAVPSQTLRANLADWVGHVPDRAVLLSLMKGVELDTVMRMSEVVAEVSGASPDRIAVVSGPTWPARSPRASRRPASSPAPTRAWLSGCSR